MWRKKPSAVASISASAFSVSITSTVWPLRTGAPIGSGHSTTVPSSMVMPSRGIAMTVAAMPLSPRPYARPRTVSTMRPTEGMYACSNGRLKGTGQWGALMRFTGVFKKSKP